MSRTNKSLRNIVFAFGVQGLTTFTSFLIRTLMIKYLGLQTVSLNGLFTEVIAALSLAELGIGSAIIYNLYKPLADNDEYKVCQLMLLFKKAYRSIAFITFTIGSALCPWVHLMVNSIEYDRGYIRLIYMLFVLQLSVSYLFSYKISLLIADQKNYIYSKYTLISKPVITIIQVLILVYIRSFTVYLITSISLTIINNCIITSIINQQYRYLKQEISNLPQDERKQIFRNIRNLFIKTLSGRITNSTDNILISTLVSTILVGYYSSYTMVFGVFRQIVDQIAYNGIKASLGNLLATENNTKCVRIFYTLTYIFYLIASFSSVCIYVCINPFVTAWLGKDYLLSTSIILISCLNLFFEILVKPLWTILDVSGLFSYDKYISIIGSLVNLIVSIILGLRIGIVGILIGTFLTYFIQTILRSLLLFKRILYQSVTRYNIMIISMFLVMLLQMSASSFVCGLITVNNIILTFIVNGIISSMIVLSTNLLLSFRTKEFQHLLQLLKGAYTKNQMNRI
jgi:O-antigen/teichoic acid export membrane protein